MKMQPIIILIAPQMGENIGAAARAMHNFGLSDLRIVNPRDGWPNEKAHSMAANAKPIIEAACIYSSTVEAIADCHHVIATTARYREMNKPQTPIQSMSQAASGQGRLAIMFGPERTGLENEDVALANSLLHIPVNPENPSLNLGQAVNIVAYEWFMQSSEFRVQSSEFSEASSRDLIAGYLSSSATDRGQQIESLVGEAVSSIAQASRPEQGGRENRDPAIKSRDDVATHGELQALFDQLETRLDVTNFWKVAEKKPSMWRNIRTSLTRAGLTSQEVQTWHGVFRALGQEKK